MDKKTREAIEVIKELLKNEYLEDVEDVFKDEPMAKDFLEEKEALTHLITIAEKYEELENKYKKLSKLRDDEMARHISEVARLEEELARIKGISVGDITHWIDDYFHYALYKNDETFSDVWGDTFCLQEARSIAKQIHNLIQGGRK